MSDTPDSFELELAAMAHGGSALGRHGKQTVFVPYAIPGERIQARITQDKGRIAFAEGVRLIEASADRVFPQCPHFGPHRCGRCQWQHIAYEAQLLLKQDVLADQLARVGGFDDATLEKAVQPLVPSPVQWGYNFHMTLEVAPGVIGFAGADKTGVFGIRECHLLHPDLLALYETLDFAFDGVRRVQLMRGSDGAQMVVLTMQEDTAPELETDLPISVNILLPDNIPLNLVGDAHVVYTVGERTFRVTAGSTFRPHIAQLDRLATVVESLLRPQTHEHVLDLYAGVGFFSAFLAKHTALVTLVESYPPAITDAEKNLRDLPNVTIIEGPVEEALTALDHLYHAAIIDPPGEGLSVEAMDALAALKLPRLVYVSSDPATLARDGQRLARHGYRLQRAQAIDLAPQTYYIDTVALFTL